MCKAPELYILNIIIHFIYIYRERERRKWQLTPVILLGKSHGQRNLASWQATFHRVGHD